MPLRSIKAHEKGGFSRLVIFLLIGFYIVAAAITLGVGAADISIANVVSTWNWQTPMTFNTRDEIILFNLRMPRLILGTIVGAALSVCGAVLQSLFRNPLADPGIIGVTAGASLGAVSMIVLGGSVLSIVVQYLGVFALPLSAFLGALLITWFIQKIATSNGKTSIITMLLAGIALQAFAMALTGILIFLADDQQLRDLTFWGLGSVAGATWMKCFITGAIVLLVYCFLPKLADALNALSLGEANAFHMGINVQRAKNIAIVCTAAATGAAVSVSGGIGFIGIIVPHLLRLIIGPDNRYLLPASALLGAIVLITADAVARTIVAPAELPIGIITALIGAPFFLWLLLQKRGLLLE
ncbi:MAG: iron chelate uptake ABC transporter family permease subunit [Pseudomonadota bacterium]